MPNAILPSRGQLSRSHIAIVVTLGVIVAATVSLWGYYGTAVFYEMILAGIAACF